MTSLLQSFMGNENDFKINDQVIANDTLAGLKGAALGYLGATLESATPEIRRMFSEYLTQSLLAHEGMTALAVKKGWYKPYLAPDAQISEAFRQSEWVLNSNT